MEHRIRKERARHQLPVGTTVATKINQTPVRTPVATKPGTSCQRQRDARSKLLYKCMQSTKRKKIPFLQSQTKPTKAAPKEKSMLQRSRHPAQGASALCLGGIYRQVDSRAVTGPRSSSLRPPPGENFSPSTLQKPTEKSIFSPSLEVRSRP